MKPVIFASVILMAIGSCFFCSFAVKPISQDEAVVLAEEFVKRNGYTEGPADTTDHKLSMELTDDPAHGLAHILKMRNSTLYPKAYYISTSKKEWHIGFVSTDVPLLFLKDSTYVSRVKGRAVIVNRTGSEIRMAHKDPIFYYFRRL